MPSHDEVARRFSLRHAPTLVLWQRGKEIGRIEGAARSDKIRDHWITCWETASALRLRPDRISPSRAATSEMKQSPQGNQPNPGWETNHPIDVSDESFEAQVLRSPHPGIGGFLGAMVRSMQDGFTCSRGNRQATCREHLKVAKVNTDENPVYASRLGIQGIPTLILFRNGREIDRIVGAAPKPALQSWIDRKLA